MAVKIIRNVVAIVLGVSIISILLDIFLSPHFSVQSSRDRYSSHLEEATDIGLENAIRSSAKPVIVVFWAEWSQQSLEMIPAYEQLALDFKDKIRVLGLNIDVYHAPPTSYGVVGLPTTIAFVNGTQKSMIVGQQRISRLREWVKESMISSAPK